MSEEFIPVENKKRMKNRVKLEKKMEQEDIKRMEKVYKSAALKLILRKKAINRNDPEMLDDLKNYYKGIYWVEVTSYEITIKPHEEHKVSGFCGCCHASSTEEELRRPFVSCYDCYCCNDDFIDDNISRYEIEVYYNKELSCMQSRNCRTWYTDYEGGGVYEVRRC